MAHPAEPLAAVIGQLSHEDLVRIVIDLAVHFPALDDALRARATALPQQIQRKLFVRNLAPATTSEQIFDVFCQYGTIEEAVVVIDPHTLRSKQYAFVIFRDMESTMRALADKMITVSGRMCEASLATITSKTLAVSATSVAPQPQSFMGPSQPSLQNMSGNPQQIQRSGFQRKPQQPAFQQGPAHQAFGPPPQQQQQYSYPTATVQGQQPYLSTQSAPRPYSDPAMSQLQYQFQTQLNYGGDMSGGASAGVYSNSAMQSQTYPINSAPQYSLQPPMQYAIPSASVYPPYQPPPSEYYPPPQAQYQAAALTQPIYSMPPAAYSNQNTLYGNQNTVVPYGNPNTAYGSQNPVAAYLQSAPVSSLSQNAPLLQSNDVYGSQPLQTLQPVQSGTPYIPALQASNPYLNQSHEAGPGSVLSLPTSTPQVPEMVDPSRKMVSTLGNDEVRALLSALPPGDLVRLYAQQLTDSGGGAEIIKKLLPTSPHPPQQ